MAEPDQLAQVDQDLTAGRSRAAVRRLQALLAETPDDIELYRLLTRAYRQEGNAVEAARWGFVTTDVTHAELEAFERAHPSPWVRLRMIGWAGSPEQLPDLSARQRLRALTALAERAGPPSRQARIQARIQARSLRERSAPEDSRFPCLFLAALLVTAGTLGAVGLVGVVSLLI